MFYTQMVDSIIPRRGVNDEGKGKKHALYRLITASKAEVVWMQDDDVVPPVCNEEQILAALGDAAMLILPLRMEADHRPNWIEKLQIAEYAAIQQVTIQTAQKGHPVMCSGANLVVRRQEWLRCWEELHPELVSGDDMFLLEAMKRHGAKIAVADGREWEAVVRPLPGLGALLRQRMRWAGKAPYYTDRAIRRYGAAVVAANLAQIICPLFILIKLPIEGRWIKKRDASVSLLTILLLEVCYPWYMLICLIGGLLRRRW